ncbi:hypothetical protein [Nostoc sp. FACHB-110]|uniref:hypothetical protein n=1 Tax=Nostoc sp. FACHB-110 TaxID=2692834 RepID=UPI001685BF43|nr:hypothetical protein [Nostoc sp. FACHB-110]MBD2439768.1 hypothetical protein [Nostoc sp. FACHB-110]
MKRDIQGKFALKNDDYRLVRSLRLTDETWKALGIAAECHGLTRADYLEQIVRENALPSSTRDKLPTLPCNTLQEEPVSQQTSLLQPQTFEALRDRILSQLKLGKQATGYKMALKALNLFIAELTKSA